MSPDHFCFLCDFFFICSEHSTFAGCHILCWVKAECSCSKASYFFSKAFCIMGLTGILDHNKLVIVCNLHYGFHVCRVSVQVDRHNGSGFWSDFFLDPFRIYIECIWLYVCKNRFCSSVKDTVCSGNEAEGTCNHFIFLPYSMGKKCNMQRCSSRVYSCCILTASVLGKCKFEFFYFRALRNHA